MAKIRKEDTVVVITGKDKGKEGRVYKVLPKENKVLVEGVQRYIRHNKVRKTDRGGTAGGRETFEGPIHISNVMLKDTGAGRKGKKATRVGFEVREGKKVRFSKQTGKEL